MAAAEQGQKIGWQLYMKADRCVSERPFFFFFQGRVRGRDTHGRKKAEEDIRKAHALGAHSIWLTVDTTIASYQIHLSRLKELTWQLGNRIRQATGAAERNPSKPGSPLVRGPVSNLLSWVSP